MTVDLQLESTTSLSDLSLHPAEGELADQVAYEGEIASLSGHLAVLESYVLPVVRGHLEGGRATARSLRRAARDLEQHLRELQARLHGDRLAAQLSPAALLERVRTSAAELAELEEIVGRQLDAVLTPAKRAAVSERIVSALEVAPTRPHPFTPHPRGLARAVFAWSASWDQAMDNMDGRTFPKAS